MDKKRRLFIFFSSALFMCFFIYFTLAIRPDNPIKKWGQWLPGNKVKSMILDRETTNGTIPRKIYYSEKAKASMMALKISELEVRHNLRNAEVVFSHEKTLPREKPKKYYLTETINKVPYFVVVEVSRQYSSVVEFGLLEKE